MSTAIQGQPDRMQCMEVWGGNRPADRFLRTTGLDIWLYSRPHGAAASGGDVYYVSSCASGRITRLLLADVSGHGDSVAGPADALRQLMRRNINYISQSALVNEINREFTEVSSSGAFATALIGTFFEPTQTLTLSNAGHPNPLIYRAKKGGWHEFSGGDEDDGDERQLPLGIEGRQTYSGRQTKLGPGDLVLWFTDGLTEVERPDGRMLGTDGLLNSVSALDPQMPEQLVPSLVEQITPHDRPINASDDASIVLFQANQERVSLRDNVFAPFRFAAGIVENWRSRDGKASL